MILLNATKFSNADSGPPSIYLGEKYLQLFEPYRHKAFFGGRGSAKSHSFAEALGIIASKTSKRVVCARQFQNSIRDSVKELLEFKMKRLRLIGKGGFKVYDREIVHEGNDSRFTFIGLDRNPDSAKSLEGADLCWVEEARSINRRSLDILIPTIRNPGSEIWWSWNPELPTDPVDEYFRGNNELVVKMAEKLEDVPGARRLVVRVGIEDNPYFYHTTLPYELEYMKQGNEIRYRHIWLGDYDEGFETKIFSNITIGRVPLEKDDVPRYGLDFGFGDDPLACIKLYILEARRVIYIAREIYEYALSIRDMPGRLLDILEHQSDPIRADSAQPILINNLNTNGFNVEGAKKGPGSVKSGINWLQGFKIVIDPECRGMIEEAHLYTWQTDRITKKRLNVPVDAHNHGWDATRYACEDYIMHESTERGHDSGFMRIPGF